MPEDGPTIGLLLCEKKIRLFNSRNYVQIYNHVIQFFQELGYILRNASGPQQNVILILQKHVLLN